MTFVSDGAAGPVVDSPAVGRRLRLKSPGAVRAASTAAGGPRSREPVAEFSALITALAADSGPVDRIGFNPASWDLAPPEARPRSRSRAVPAVFRRKAGQHPKDHDVSLWHAEWPSRCFTRQ
jgi:hypothetical protein